MADKEQGIQIPITASGGDKAAAEIRKPSAAIAAWTSASKQLAPNIVQSQKATKALTDDFEQLALQLKKGDMEAASKMAGRLRQELDKVDDITDEARESIIRFTNGLDKMGRQAQFSGTSLGQAFNRAATASRQASGGTRNMGLAALEASRAFEDLQYGVRGVLNNIPVLLMNLGVGAGLTGVISIVLVTLTQLIPKLFDLGDAAEQSAEQVADAQEHAADAVERNKERIKAAIEEEARVIYDAVNRAADARVEAVDRQIEAIDRLDAKIRAKAASEAEIAAKKSGLATARIDAQEQADLQEIQKKRKEIQARQRAEDARTDSAQKERTREARRQELDRIERAREMGDVSDAQALRAIEAAKARHKQEDQADKQAAAAGRDRTQRDLQELDRQEAAVRAQAEIDRAAEAQRLKDTQTQAALAAEAAKVQKQEAEYEASREKVAARRQAANQAAAAAVGAAAQQSQIEAADKRLIDAQQAVDDLEARVKEQEKEVKRKTGGATVTGSFGGATPEAQRAELAERKKLKQDKADLEAARKELEAADAAKPSDQARATAAAAVKSANDASKAAKDAAAAADKEAEKKKEDLYVAKQTQAITRKTIQESADLEKQTAETKTNSKVADIKAKGEAPPTFAPSPGIQAAAERARQIAEQAARTGGRSEDIYAQQLLDALDAIRDGLDPGELRSIGQSAENLAGLTARSIAPLSEELRNLAAKFRTLESQLAAGRSYDL